MADTDVLALSFSDFLLLLLVGALVVYVIPKHLWKRWQTRRQLRAKERRE